MSTKSYILNPSSSYTVKCTFYRGDFTKVHYRATPAKDEFEALLDAQKNVIANLYDHVLFEIVNK